MKTRLQQFLILLVMLAGIHQASAQGTTAFTYQGQLHDSSTNANGTYTMIFALYSAATGGTQIGSTVTNSATLANGLFTVNLDFGNVFTNGNARWLDITITNGGVTQELSPRVQVLPTPYALYAATANVAAVATTAPNGVSLGGTNYIPNIQVFASSGTFVVPAGVNRIEVEMWGAGGGGGAAYYGPASGGTGNSNGGNDNGFSGGGGGAGAYAWNVFTVTNGTSFTVTAGTAGSAGHAGTGSSFGNLLSASGGSAGGNAGSGGSGNGGSGGQTTYGSLVNVQGNSGQSGDTTGDGIGGDGGTVWRGGPAGRGSFYGSGSDGNGPGAGGAGAGPSSSSSNSAGNGDLGVVIVYY